MVYASCGIESCWRLLQPGTTEQQKADVQPVERQLTQQDRAILCRECKAEITSIGKRIEVDGAHQYTFFNPYGLLFEIGCFADAPGAVVAGEPNDDFSWFPGFKWQHALCSSCGTHLGWKYTAVASSFFGLILKRLEERE